MGLHLSQLLLRRFDLEAMLKAVGPIWAKHIAADREHPKRQLVLLLAPPWVVLLDSSSSIPRQIGLELTSAAGGEAIWVSVAATTFAVQIHRAVEGETVEDRSEPRPEADGRMPPYVDAEGEAWDYLKRAGLPPEFRLIRIRDLDPRAPAKGERANMIFFERPAFDQPIQHGYVRFSIPQPNTENDGPPSEYSVMAVEKKFLADMHVVFGRPDPERVDHLLQVLDRIARRKVRPADFTYSVTVTGEDPSLAPLLKDRYAALNAQHPFAFTL